MIIPALDGEYMATKEDALLSIPYLEVNRVFLSLLGRKHFRV